MKFFDATVWKTAQAASPAIDSVMNGFAKLRGTPPVQKVGRAGIARQTSSDTGAVSYALSPGFIKTFATSGLPFLTFYEFIDLAGWHRDTYFAPDHVENYEKDIGKSYTIWTHETNSAYRRHIFLDDLTKDMTISFEIPALDTASWFPLRISIRDRDGLYFQHDQKLVVDRLSEGGASLTSWKKIPTLKASLPRLHRRTCAAQ